MDVDVDVELVNLQKLAAGRNSALINSHTDSIHAESDGINNLHRLNMHRRFLKLGEKIDILVVRLSKTGIIGSSRPCRNCLLRLAKSPYPINKVYYSYDPDTIRCEKFKYMFDSPLTRMSSADRLKKANRLKKVNELKKVRSNNSSSFSSSGSDIDQNRSRSNSSSFNSKRRRNGHKT